MVRALYISCPFSTKLEQLQQEHSSVQVLPEEKHSQYNLRHPVFLQTHPVFFFFFGVLKLSNVPITTTFYLSSIRFSSQPSIHAYYANYALLGKSSSKDSKERIYFFETINFI
jgi:hypothetical protein